MQTKEQKRKRRHNRIRATVSGTHDRPRLAVFRSNKHINAQLIDDTQGTTIFSVSDKDIKKAEGQSLTQRATYVGALIAQKAQEKKITHVVFDRGGFYYTGVVAALAQGAREGGLTF